MEWRDVVGYEGLYKVSAEGDIVGSKRGIRKKFKNPWGYYALDLTKNGKDRHWLVHRIVAIAFIPNPLNKSEVNHLNGNKIDNRIANLAWVTPRENRQHALEVLQVRTGFIKNHKTRAVIAESANGEIVIFPSMYEAQKAGHILSNIHKCIIGERKRHHGFTWKNG